MYPFVPDYAGCNKVSLIMTRFITVIGKSQG